MQSCGRKQAEQLGTDGTLQAFQLVCDADDTLHAIGGLLAYHRRSADYASTWGTAVTSPAAAFRRYPVRRSAHSELRFERLVGTRRLLHSALFYYTRCMALQFCGEHIHLRVQSRSWGKRSHLSAMYADASHNWSAIVRRARGVALARRRVFMEQGQQRITGNTRGIQRLDP